jgi:hypothetical protein
MVKKGYVIVARSSFYSTLEKHLETIGSEISQEAFIDGNGKSGSLCLFVPKIYAGIAKSRIKDKTLSQKLRWAVTEDRLDQIIRYGEAETVGMSYQEQIDYGLID